MVARWEIPALRKAGSDDGCGSLGVAVSRRSQAVSGRADPFRGNGRAILARRAVGGVPVECIGGNGDLRSAVSRVRRAASNLDGGRGPAALAARRAGAVLCRAGHALDGRADRAWKGWTND